MSKQQLPVLDDAVFTFHPKLSTTSTKIVENMGTDFMARQQQHMERQRKMIEGAGYSFRSTFGHLSPLNDYKRLKERRLKNDGESVTANMQDRDNSTSPYSTNGTADVNELSDAMTALSSNKARISPGLQQIMDETYEDGNADMVLKRHKTRIHLHQKGNKSVSDTSYFDDDREELPDPSIEEDDFENGALSRSKTMPTLGRQKLSSKISSLNSSNDRITTAKDLAEKAIKLKKVFTIQGGYSTIRQSLRRRGWVEKFYRIPGPHKSGRKRHGKVGDEDEENDDDGDDNDDDDDDTDSDNDQPRVPPWQEDDGIYGIMSRMVRNVNPTFMWVLKRDVIDYRCLSKDQMVNHYSMAGAFTTKVGLCVNMRQVSWFDESDPDEFFPRCYRLSHEEEKAAFIDDFHMTACINILKIVISHNSGYGYCNESDKSENIKVPADEDKPFTCTDQECARSRLNAATENICVHELQKNEEEERKKKELHAGVAHPQESSRKKKKKRSSIPQQCLEMAIAQCDKYLSFKCHDDIDQQFERDVITPAQWDELIVWYYQLAHEGGTISCVPVNVIGQIENILNRIKAVSPQYELDGTRNVWIVKPGAKSRGRGITCYDHLEDMLKLVNSQVVRKDNKFVVQKYIERPLLVYNCKFDIRQWFLVTDWNPLTIYFYMDSYLRFCSQEFTLEDYDESIHLSNNAIQKHYKNGIRAKELPEENMWTHKQFKNYIKSQKLGNLWDDMIYPGMKKAVICALLSTQDLIEYRKASFELYGADFMLTEDYKPWLIEINSSPSMESSTEVTARLCSSVLEDTLKVVLDRKWDRNCDIGMFELAYKQSLVTVPPYHGISLCVEGNQIKKPGSVTFKKSTDVEPVFSYHKEKQVIFNDRLFGNSIETRHKTAGNSRQSHSDNEHDENGGYLKSAPVKKYTTKEPTDSTGNFKRRSQRRKSLKVLNNSNYSNCIASVTEKCISDNVNEFSQNLNEHFVIETDLSTDDKSEIGGNRSAPSSSAFVPKLLIGSGAIPTKSYINLTQKIVSRTSVSSNYNIPTMDSKERPMLTVSNVDTAELRTVKAQAKGLYRLIESNIAPACMDCDNGNINHFCKCHHHGIRYVSEHRKWSSHRVKSVRSRTSCFQGLVSPRQPSASKIQNRRSCNMNNSGITNSSHLIKKVLLRYTDGRIQQPMTPHFFTGTNPLPRAVRKYIGQRVSNYHIVSLSQNSPLIVDTVQLNEAMSLISHGFYAK